MIYTTPVSCLCSVLLSILHFTSLLYHTDFYWRELICICNRAGPIHKYLFLPLFLSFSTSFRLDELLASSRAFVYLLVSTGDCQVEGEPYTGTISVTQCGIPCQRWYATASHTPDQFMIPENIPEGSLHRAENYCRNPDNDKGPWCYTTDPEIRWQYCDISVCSENAESQLAPSQALLHIDFSTGDCRQVTNLKIPLGR